MILEKVSVIRIYTVHLTDFWLQIPGVPANTVWDTLPLHAKETLVRDVAKHLLSLFRLRFLKAGSLYISSSGSIEVGPIVSTPFFRALDGEVRFPEEPLLDLSQFRGPFTSVTEYLSAAPKTELFVLNAQRDAVLRDLDESKLSLGIRVLEKVLRLIEIYPGDMHIVSEAERFFSLKLADFRLSNIMV
jgi:hypothetical protein